MKNKPLPRRPLIFILIIAMAALPLGCLSSIKDDTQVVITASPQLQASATPVLEDTVTATVSPTRKPTATFPPTRTPLPLQTDLPTIEPGNTNAMIDLLYSRCDLPCWGGIIPGKTSQYAAKRLLDPLGEWYNPSSTPGEWGPLGSVSFQYNNTSTSINLTFGHGLVRSIHLYPELTRPYRINRLFTEYGKPEAVQSEILPLTADLTSWFTLLLLYPQQGFFAILSAQGTVINSTIHMCPRNVSPDLYLFASNVYSLNQMNEVVSTVRPRMVFQALDAVAEVDEEQFYDIFLGQSVNCVATKYEFQLPP